MQDTALAYAKDKDKKDVLRVGGMADGSGRGTLSRFLWRAMQSLQPEKRQEAKPIFLISTKNKSLINSRCSLGIEHEHTPKQRRRRLRASLTVYSETADVAGISGLVPSWNIDNSKHLHQLRGRSQSRSVASRPQTSGADPNRHFDPILPPPSNNTIH